MAESPNTFTAYIDPRFTFKQRQQIGQDIIKFIRTRSSNNKGVSGVRFKNYEPTYANSKEFKAAGKSISNPNVKLNGSMLNDLKVVDASLAGRVVIGFRTEKSNDKSVWIREKGYHFLGLSNDELSFVTAKYTVPSTTDRDIIQQVIAVRQPKEDEEENGN